MAETKTKTKTEKYFYAYGRRKTSVATIRLFSGNGESKVNEVELKQYFPLESDRKVVLMPLAITEKLKDFYFTSKVKGGGKKSQREAIRHALARALVVSDEDLKPALKKHSLMTRDDRMVDRKKTGLVKARKAHQYSKR